jgi:hypothetical protein
MLETKKMKDSEIKNKIIRIRLTQSEFDFLNEQKEKYNENFISSFVRKLALLKLKKRPIQNKEKLYLLKNLLVELNKIGSNINQIAKVANSKNYINFEKLENSLNEFDNLKTKIIKEIL